MTKHETPSTKIHEVFAYLRTRDCKAAIDFYERAFGALEEFRLTESSGRVGHAELKFGETTVMVSDEYPEYGIHGPKKSVPTGSSIHLHVEDVDAVTRKAVEAGAKIIMEPKDQFYGERTSKVLDPYDHEWLLGSHIEDVSPEEMQRRFNAMFENEDASGGGAPS
jgi:uncharacterized glyoxalase superfamily protein PhnB